MENTNKKPRPPIGVVFIVGLVLGFGATDFWHTVSNDKTETRIEDDNDLWVDAKASFCIPSKESNALHIHLPKADPKDFALIEGSLNSGGIKTLKEDNGTYYVLTVDPKTLESLVVFVDKK
jgi:hypothetical protein